MSNIEIEVLSRRHKSLVKHFQNREPSLVQYLQHFALKHSEKALLAQTHVAVLRDGQREELAGYFSLIIESVERASLAHIPALDKLPRFPTPGILLARLAVDERAQGQGLGRFLFEEALGRSLRLCEEGPLRFRLFVTGAVNEDAASFYEHFDLVRLGQAFPLRMALDLNPLLQGP